MSIDHPNNPTRRMRTRQVTAAANVADNTNTNSVTSATATTTAVAASTDIAATGTIVHDHDQSPSLFVPAEPVEELNLEIGPVEPEEELNLEEYLTEVNSNSRRVIRTREELEALNATDVTKGHYNRAGKLERKFLEGLAAISKCDTKSVKCDFSTCTPFSPSSTIFSSADSDGKQIWAKMLELVPNPNHTPGDDNSPPLVARAFVAISGIKTPAKKSISNKMFCDWQMYYKMVRPTVAKNAAGVEKICWWYQPSTQNMEFRTTLAKFKKDYGFCYSMADFQGYKGCLGGVMQDLYEVRKKEFVSEKNEK